jgi:stage II sporulation protein M
MKKKTKEKNFFKKNYIEGWNYLKDSRNFIFAIVLIFLIFAFIGAFVPAPEPVVEKIKEFVSEILEKTEGMSQNELIGFIFFNNFQSSLTSMIFGVFFGILPLISTIMNGYLVGYIASIGVNAGGFLILWRLLPHGIFELPAIFISLGLGLKLGTFILQKEKMESLKNYSINSLKVFLLIVLPLLIIAAIIEGSLIYLFS